jgi:AcrR family transcriptional regulator
MFAQGPCVHETRDVTPPTRRERIRAETITEIKTAALAQIAADGAAALSIRAVARTIGMSPAGLYRYYDGRDGLLTELITDAYDDLADAVEAATIQTGGSAWERFGAGVRAYRRWATAEPNRFLLIFGTPVPGYAAPEHGPTVAANQRMGRAFFQLAAEAWREGEIAAPPEMRPATSGEISLAAELAPGFPPAMVARLLGAWSQWHGMVTLEVTNQLHWLYGADLDPFVESSIDQILSGLGASR